MRLILRLAGASVLVLAASAGPPPLAFAANLDTTADRIFGQPDFIHNTVNNGGLSATSLYANSGVALDAQGNLYVADTNNNRVLEYDAPLTAGAIADRVFGQPDFTHDTANNGGISANSLQAPSGVVLDAQGNLYVADSGNYRVLEYDNPLSTNTTADRVFGQPDFAHNTANNGGLNANGLSYPASVALDAQGNLYVADAGNSRVLEYDAPLTTNRTADRVFGQPDFTHKIVNNGGVSANSLYAPSGVALDAQGN
ncbi:MAG: NHL repeat-containing protein, partial [Anaerolineales bacterium]